MIIMGGACRACQLAIADLGPAAWIFLFAALRS